MTVVDDLPELNPAAMHFGTALILVHAVLEAIKDFHEKSDTI
jgi:hypothetical protein